MKSRGQTTAVQIPEALSWYAGASSVSKARVAGAYLPSVPSTRKALAKAGREPLGPGHPSEYLPSRFPYAQGRAGEPSVPVEYSSVKDADAAADGQQPYDGGPAKPFLAYCGGKLSAVRTSGGTDAFETDDGTAESNDSSQSTGASFERKVSGSSQPEPQPMESDAELSIRTANAYKEVLRLANYVATLGNAAPTNVYAGKVRFLVVAAAASTGCA